jgi:phage I-like protein
MKKKKITNNKLPIFYSHPSLHKKENMVVLPTTWWKGKFVYQDALHMLFKWLRHLLRAGI